MNKFLILISICIVLSCKKQDPELPFEQENVAQDGLTQEQDSIIAAQPSKIFTPAEIVFDDGETLEAFMRRTDPGALATWGHRGSQDGANQRIAAIDFYKKFVQDITDKGNEMVSNRTPHPQEASVLAPKLDAVNNKILKDGEPIMVTYEKPEQIGYGYVFNTDLSLDKRKVATNCNLMLYGIECSGMATLMLRRAGLNIARDKAANMATEEALNTALVRSPLLSNMDLEYVDRSQSLPLNEIRTGDILYFRQKGGTEISHMGIAIGTYPAMYIYQSNGTKDIVTPGCERWNHRLPNDPRNRGPRCVLLLDFIREPPWQNYGVLHLEAKKPIDPVLITDPATSPGIPPNLLNGWKFASESSIVSQGTKKIPVKSVIYSDIILSFNKYHEFTISARDADDPGNPYSCSGTFVLINNQQSIQFTGCDLYEKNVTKAKIEQLTPTSLTLTFKLNYNGIRQTSQLRFVK